MTPPPVHRRFTVVTTLVCPSKGEGLVGSLGGAALATQANIRAIQSPVRIAFLFILYRFTPIPTKMNKTTNKMIATMSNGMLLSILKLAIVLFVELAKL